MRGIVNELQELLVTNGDIQQLEEHLEQIEQWKKKATMLLELREDEPRPAESAELFSDLLRESSAFKFNVAEVHDLHEKVEYFEWKDQVRGVCSGGRGSVSLA